MKHLKKRPVHMKYPQHLNLAKGGAVVQKFAEGGTPQPIAVQGSQLSGPSAPPPVTNTVPADTTASGFKSIPGGTTAQSVENSYGINDPVGNAIGSAVQSGVNKAADITQQTMAGAGQFAQGIAKDFTVQNEFQATGAPIQEGTNADQLNAAYNGTQGALNQQQGIVNTLTPGVNQGAQSQANLSNMLMNQARGQGPNPAQAALNQQTGANVAAQAALMAGQRGAGANAGLIARQAAQQGANTQQQAVGQGATLQAQQQIAAEQNLQNLAANQVGQGTAAVEGLNNAQQNEQNILQGANTAYNNAQVSQQSNLNTVNAGVASQNAAANNKTMGGMMGGASSVLGALFADGGAVEGASTSSPPPSPEQWISSTPAASSISISSPASPPAESSDSSGSDKSGGGMGSMMGGLAALLAKGGNVTKGPHRSHVANFLASGGRTGEVKAIVSPKEVYLSPDQVHKVVHEGADPMRIGYRFPGTDKVKGRDSKKNDVIPTTLQDGGCVIPVHITTHKEASERGRKFVARTMAKHMKRPAGAK